MDPHLVFHDGCCPVDYRKPLGRLISSGDESHRRFIRRRLRHSNRNHWQHIALGKSVFRSIQHTKSSIYGPICRPTCLRRSRLSSGYEQDGTRGFKRMEPLVDISGNERFCREFCTVAGRSRSERLLPSARMGSSIWCRIYDWIPGYCAERQGNEPIFQHLPWRTDRANPRRGPRVLFSRRCGTAGHGAELI